MKSTAAYGGLQRRLGALGYPNLMQSYGGLLEPRGSNLTPLKSTLMLKICLGLSPVIFAQFTLEM